MKAGLFLLFCFAAVVQISGKENEMPFLSSGGSFSSYESRFYRKSQDTVWLRGDFCGSISVFSIREKENCLNSKFFLEKRNERLLTSVAFETNRFYLSYGNRFKPSRHFFFLRETFEFSSFWFLDNRPFAPPLQEPISDHHSLVYITRNEVHQKVPASSLNLFRNILS